MASTTKTDNIGEIVLARERALAADKLKDMKKAFAQPSRMMDAATILHVELDGFTEKYGMNWQAIDALFGLSSSLPIIRYNSYIMDPVQKQVYRVY